MRRRSRFGFTLFQLLVVLAFLAILLGLFLPAVFKVRMAANRMQSQNNLKQIALACHNYHDVNGSFPPGNDGNNFSAAAHLLPYLEQDAVYKQIDFNKDMGDEANATVRKLRIPTFQSPDDPLMSPSAYGPTNYLYSAGTKPELQDNDGIFFQDSKVRIADITDGTSNTFLVGETLMGDGSTKATDVRRQHVLLDKDAVKDIKDDAGVQEFKDNKHIVGDRCASWLDGRFLQGTFTGTRGVNDTRPDVSCGGIGGLSALRTLQETVNVAFCDGSVHAVKVKIDPKVWKHLITRSGGEIITSSDF
jgi:prepilin-type processing-associated H-X9-DG protein